MCMCGQSGVSGCVWAELYLSVCVCGQSGVSVCVWAELYLCVCVCGQSGVSLCECVCVSVWEKGKTRVFEKDQTQAVCVLC